MSYASEARIQQLVRDWHRYHKERDREASPVIRSSLEGSIERVETELQRDDIDPRNYSPEGVLK